MKVMKQPSSAVTLSGWILVVLGLSFQLAAYLNRIGVLKTSPNSTGDPAVAFPILGLIFLAVGVACLLSAQERQNARLRLRDHGVQLRGCVTEIKCLSYMHWGNRSPYVVRYSYYYDGETYTGKSELLWEAPKLHQSEILTVYMDPRRPKKSTAC